MKISIKLSLLLLGAFCILFSSNLLSNKVNKTNSPETIIVKDTIVVHDTIYVYKPLNKENVLSELIRQEVPHAKIVLSQSLLETGHYTSSLSKTHNNIFGMRTSKGYKKYDNYSECIADYKKRISSRYKGGDYFAFLQRIGYAEDPDYVNKLKSMSRNI